MVIAGADCDVSFCMHTKAETSVLVMPIFSYSRRIT